MKEPRINDRIRAREVRVISSDGGQLGIKPLPEALNLARGLELDLVEVAPDARPPVCRIMDYGKYKYEASQRAKESRKKSTHVVVKEMKYRPKISGGDFETKTRKVEGFLHDGHKVKITIMFRGREVTHPELGRKILDRIADRTDDYAKVEAYPRLDGRNMTMVLGPDPKKAKQRAQEKKKEEARLERERQLDEEVALTAEAQASEPAAAPSAEEAKEEETPAAAETAAAAEPETGSDHGKQDEDPQGSEEALQDDGDGEGSA